MNSKHQKNRWDRVKSNKKILYSTIGGVGALVTTVAVAVPVVVTQNRTQGELRKITTGSAEVIETTEEDTKAKDAPTEQDNSQSDDNTQPNGAPDPDTTKEQVVDQTTSTQTSQTKTTAVEEQSTQKTSVQNNNEQSSAQQEQPNQQVPVQNNIEQSAVQQPKEQTQEVAEQPKESTEVLKAAASTEVEKSIFDSVNSQQILENTFLPNDHFRSKWVASSVQKPIGVRTLADGVAAEVVEWRYNNDRGVIIASIKISKDGQERISNHEIRGFIDSSTQEGKDEIKKWELIVGYKALIDPIEEPSESDLEASKELQVAWNTYSRQFNGIDKYINELKGKDLERATVDHFVGLVQQYEKDYEVVHGKFSKAKEAVDKHFETFKQVYKYPQIADTRLFSIQEGKYVAIYDMKTGESVSQPEFKKLVDGLFTAAKTGVVTTVKLVERTPERFVARITAKMNEDYTRVEDITFIPEGRKS